MANPYFQFKQFRIEQGACAMKVSTDACLFGAIVPALTADSVALDIGTGTGLLSLMLAQRSPPTARIDAVELDELAAQQARVNFQHSPWAPQLELWQGPIQSYRLDGAACYSLILANPPFFQSGSRSLLAERAAARHTDSLRFDELLSAVSRLLVAEGEFWVLLPVSEQASFRDLAERIGLMSQGGWEIAPRAAAAVHRYISCWRWSAGLANPSFLRLDIRQESGDYSPEFCRLLRPYYLHL